MNIIISELCAASKDGDIESLQKVLVDRYVIRYPYDLHIMPLHEAAAHDQIACLQVLLDAGGQVDRPDGQGQTPLHKAASKGSTGCLQVLLDAGAEKDAQDKDSKTPLHHAAANGQITPVGILLKAGAKTDIRDVNGFTALHLAVIGGHLNITQFFLQHGNWKSLTIKGGPGELSCLDLASKHGHTAVENFLGQYATGMHFCLFLVLHNQNGF